MSGNWVKFVVETGAFVERVDQLPRPRAPWTTEQWLNPGALVPGCPAEFAGFGWAPISFGDAVGTDTRTVGEADVEGGARVDGGMYWDAPRPLIERDLDDAKERVRMTINTRRADARWGTVQADVNGDGSLIVPVDFNGEEDRANVTGLTVTANELRNQGVTGPAIDFTGADNVSVGLTPDQVIALGLACSVHFQAAYGIARALKAAVDAAKTITELEAIDIDAAFAA